MITPILFIVGVLSGGNNATHYQAPQPSQAVPVAQTAPVAIPNRLALLPEPKPKQPKRQMWVTVYGYSSTPDQTDSSPLITASGQTVSNGIVAMNCVPFGTQIGLPGIFPDRLFQVQDRMAPRHGCSSIDVWFPDRASAYQFGKRRLLANVY